MQRLNLRKPKVFDYSEEAGKIKPRAKFYCVSEGATEESYFRGIRNNKVELDIKNDVIIEIVEKAEGQENFSHPQQLIHACLFSMGRIDAEGNELPEIKWEENCKWESFDKDLDTVCVIFDRDYRKLELCLDDLMETCNKNNIFIGVSNPNFELWLLMHFPNIESHDPDILLKNPKNLRRELFPDASKEKKYLEIVLSRAAEGYKKGCKIDFENYKLKIPLALEQAEKYCEEPAQLKTELGTTIGKLIKCMKEK